MPIETVYNRIEKLEEITEELLYKNLAVLEAVFNMLSDDNPYKMAVYTLIQSAKEDLREYLK